MSDITDMDEAVYVAIIKVREVYVVMADDDGIVTIADSEEEGLGWFTKTYHDWIQRGGTWAGSIAVFWMQFQPSIIRTNGKQLHELIGGERGSLVKMRSVSGSSSGFMCKNETLAAELWEHGAKPPLVPSA